MLGIFSKLIVLSVVITGALVLGQFHFRGVPIGRRVSSLIGIEIEREIAQNPERQIDAYIGEKKKEIPEAISSLRRKLAIWLYPSVASRRQPQKN